MNKGPLLSFIIFCLFFFNFSEELLPAFKYSKPRLFIKFRGNINFLDGGMFRDMIDEDRDYFETLRNSNKDYVVTTDEDPFFTGYGAEIGIEAGKYAVGIDVSFLVMEYLINYTFRIQETNYQDQYIWKQRFYATPIFINNYFKIIDGRLITSFITIGGGIYMSKITYSKNETFQNGSLSFANTNLEGKRNFLGLHLGVSAELNIGKNMIFFFETMYRYVGFKNFSGTLRYEDDLDSYEVNDDLLYIINKNTGKGKFWVGSYSSENWEENPVFLNMKGFSLSAGMKIIFGSKGK